VAGVAYPELESHPDHALARKLLPRGAGSVFSFTLKGGRPAGRKFIEALRVFSHLANVGDAKSLVIHPASTTHFRMSDEALVAAGIHPGTIRLSIGLEDAGDLIEDLEPRPRCRRQGLTWNSRSTASRPTPTPAARHSTPPCPPSSSSTARRTTIASGAAEPLVRPSRLRRAGRRSARPRPQRRQAAAVDRGPRRLDRIAAGKVGAGDTAKKVSLVGHSMGSLAALECAARHPARIARIALFGTAVPMPVSDALLDAAKNDEPKAISMINTWSHSPRAAMGGYAVPGIWHFGARAAWPSASCPACCTTTWRPAMPMATAWKRRHRSPARC
jgi:hypothetical protein